MKRASRGFVALAVAAAVSGCGGAGGAVSVANLLNLDGGELVGISRTAEVGVPTGEQTFERIFEDRSLGGRPGSGGRPGREGRWRIGQGIARLVRVSVPEGVSFPTTFTLRDITLSLRIGDGDRVAERTVTIADPVTFTRSGESDVYTAGSALSTDTTFTEGSFETLHAILTTAPSPNTVTATLRYDASTELPAGAALRFAFEHGIAQMH